MLYENAFIGDGEMFKRQADVTCCHDRGSLSRACGDSGDGLSWVPTTHTPHILHGYAYCRYVPAQRGGSGNNQAFENPSYCTIIVVFNNLQCS